MALITKDLDALRIDRSRSGTGGAGRWLLVALPMALAVALIAVVSWWLVSSRAPVVQVGQVRQLAAASGTTVLNASGYVTARRQATVSSKVTGKVLDVRVEEGMAIREGEIVARLDDARPRAVLELAESQLAASRAALDETRSQLDLAELTLARTDRLAREDVTGQAELDAAETEVRTLRARLALQEEEVRVAEREVAVRRTELDDTIIRAPFDGVVISKDAQPGEMVSPVSAGGGFTRTGICTVVDMASLEIEVDVNEAYIRRVASGQRVEAVLDAYPDWRIPAQVITSIPAADRQKATVLVRIGFDELDPRILPDMGVKVAFLEAGAAERPSGRARLLLPRAALRRDGDRDIVFVVEDDTVERRAVSVGPAAEDESDVVEALSGLSAGEWVVVEGPEDLKDGDAVRIR